MKKHLSEETREQKTKRWLVEDTSELLIKCKERLTHTELVMMLVDSLGSSFVDIVDKKKINLEDFKN
jgi:hypothetical protein